jgi:choline/glycine/proline betaine transport protein
MSQKGNEVPIDRPVYLTSCIVLGLLAGAAVLFPEQTASMFDALLAGIIANGSWYYVLVVTIIFVAVALLAASRFGDIRLGPDHASPDYSRLSWFSMLFAAGMGIGLMFFGVAEPVMHYLAPPLGEGGSVDSAREAMKLTFFHWGLHAWSIYAIVAMILAYFSFRHGLPLTLRSALYPLIGERIHGPIGVAVDVFAVVGTTFGVATSLGFGVEQINAGLNYLFDVPKGPGTQVVLVVVTMLLAGVSLLTGLDRGIKRLSETNIVLAVGLLLLVLVLGPTVDILQALMQNTGGYLSDLAGKTLNLYAYDPTDWLGGWTIFYWGWWMSWAPFVGLFIARISRGRTIREFVLGAMLIPAGFTLLWMTVFGNTAIDLIHNQGDVALGAMVEADPAVALFGFLERFPFSGLLSAAAIVMVLIFFITSADSGALVLNMLSSHGRDDTPPARRAFWVGVIGVAAIALLLAGGLSALQTATIAGAFPFSLALLAGMWGFRKALVVDLAKRDIVLASTSAIAPDGWPEHLRQLLSFPGREEAYATITDRVRPAVRAVADEFARNGVTTRVASEDQGLRLEVLHGAEIDFVYEVRVRSHPLPDAALSGTAETAEYYRPEVHLSEGGQGYDVADWPQSRIEADIVEHYERHLQFLHTLR